ncbi:ATP-binding protein [Gottschalkiaceae bacterium SANA]|nr:ATP-binding protein [Gottschalkiaceae bacterium SANA]
MKIAILSGKGGTGKTTLATNLFKTKNQGILIDVDVEEPNSHLFLKPLILDRITIKKGYPVVDAAACTLCGACGDFCRYNAILPTKKKVLVYPELCHDCGGCQLVCPTNAIHYDKRTIGNVFSGKTESGLSVAYGDLLVGEVSGVHIIEHLREMTDQEPLVFIDSPPGTACSTVAAVEGVDYAIIAAEPTPFGVSDMKLVVEMLSGFSIPMGVVINKAGLGDQEIYEYCKEENLTILAEIPFSKAYAKSYASGKMLCDDFPEFRENMEEILDQIIKD